MIKLKRKEAVPSSKVCGGAISSVQGGKRGYSFPLSAGGGGGIGIFKGAKKKG